MKMRMRPVQKVGRLQKNSAVTTVPLSKRVPRRAAGEHAEDDPEDDDEDRRRREEDRRC